MNNLAWRETVKAEIQEAAEVEGVDEVWEVKAIRR
jgi:hypothetical protein